MHWRRKFLQTEILNVTQLHELVSQTLEFAYPEIIVEGEVASYKVSHSKWVFFDLKDSQTSVGCFMTLYQLKHKIEDGMMIRVTCKPTLTKWGKFSLTVRQVELVGEGSVARAFELLKTELEKEGLFAVERKRELPKFPKRVGLITSKQAAAYNDFNTIINQRWSGLEISHYQVQVQGEGAVEQIVKALDWFNQSSLEYDVIVMIRGGGSMDDLVVFNSELVARAVFASRLPTLVAIGHEDDVTLAELTADKRAATPTDAANKLVADKNEYIAQINHVLDKQKVRLEDLLNHSKSILEHYFVISENCINNAMHGLERSENTIINSIIRRLESAKFEYEQYNLALIGLNPQAILKRGYAIASVNGSVIYSPEDIKNNEVLLRLYKGSTLVKQVKRDNK